MTGLPLLDVRGLRKQFVAPRGERVVAVAGVDLRVGAGEIVGLVGESGSGKTTLGRLIARLEQPDEGTIQFGGVDLLTLDARALRAMRRRLQIVFQDPGAALNPRLSVEYLVSEPGEIHGLWTRSERHARACALLAQVGLAADLAGQRPGQLSGGQKQRVMLARALSLRPELVVCDELVSALDPSVAAQIVNQLVEWQRRDGTAYLFISHDLRLVLHLCDRIYVMHRGRIVEEGSAADVALAPRHAYTQALFAATPPLAPPPERGQWQDGGSSHETTRRVPPEAEGTP